MQVKKYLPLFLALKRLRPNERRDILPFLDKTARESIYTLVNSVLKAPKDKFKSRKALVRKLGPHIASLRHLTKRSNSERKKLRVLRDQIGGFPLGLLLSAAIPLITSLVGGGGGAAASK